jgi:carbonic anhydrase
MPSDPTPSWFSPKSLRQDLIAGLVVFLVALPLCLGIALACKAPPFSGLIAGIVGGILVGILSGSHTSVSGPAAGLVAVVIAQAAKLGTFEVFTLAVLLAGGIQVVAGLLRAGNLAAFFPSSVIKGLLAAIGVLLILKELPHVVGHDKDPEGEMSFFQPDQRNTFTEYIDMIDDFQTGSAIIGIIAILLIVAWDRVKFLKKSIVPAPLVVVGLGIALSELFKLIGPRLDIDESHMVAVPVASSAQEFLGFFKLPDFTALGRTDVYFAAVTIAIVASLETLLNLEAVDKLDPQQRTSPSNRELIAQGCGNTVSGFLGGLPITSVIVRSSVNINAGGRTKLSAIFHGVLLLLCIAFLASFLNRIPRSCLSAILLMTGIKLASPKLFKEMWKGGKQQFIPFIATVIAIVLTDLLVGVLIGLATSIGFILYSNYHRPLNKYVEKHLGGEVLRVELANQVSFLNRAALQQTLEEVPPGGHIMLDASQTAYIDPDILDMIREFREVMAPTRGISVSLKGFRDNYEMEDHIQYVDYSTRELQSALTPLQVIDILKEGNQRFQNGQHLTRDYRRQMSATAAGQHPLAVLLTCIDSRTPSELIFDLGVGDIFVSRIAGNTAGPKVLGSIEYACAVAGAKLVLVMGHTHCGAVTAAVSLAAAGQKASTATGCGNLDSVVEDIQKSVDAKFYERYKHSSDDEKLVMADECAKRNVEHAVKSILAESETVRRLVAEGRIQVVGAMYDITTGRIEFLPATS